MLFAAEQHDAEVIMRNSVFIHVDQGRDDSSPYCFVLRGSQYVQPASPRPPGTRAGLIA